MARDVNVTLTTTVNGATPAQILSTSTLNYSITGFSESDGQLVSRNGSQTLPQILQDLTPAQRKIWLERVMYIAARMAYFGDEG